MVRRRHTRFGSGESRALPEAAKSTKTSRHTACQLTREPVAPSFAYLGGAGMVDVQSPAPGLAHVVFLERAARDLDSSGSKYGQAAFLVLRLVNLLASEPRPGASDDLFGYQTAATGRYCEEQLEPGIDADHLLDVVRSASYA